MCGNIYIYRRVKLFYIHFKVAVCLAQYDPKNNGIYVQEIAIQRGSPLYLMRVASLSQLDNGLILTRSNKRVTMTGLTPHTWRSRPSRVSWSRNTACLNIPQRRVLHLALSHFYSDIQLRRTLWKYKHKNYYLFRLSLLFIQI